MNRAELSAVDSPDADAVEGSPTTSWTTADLFDEHESGIEVCDTTFLRFGRRRAFSGRCEAVQTDEDHRVVLEALSQPGEGRVLVVDGGGNPRVGVLGDRLARIGSENGWAGAVVHGAIRDSDIIDELDFGVFAVGVTARRSLHADPGRVATEVQFGGATFRRGCWVYADANSVLTSPRALA